MTHKIGSTPTNPYQPLQPEEEVDIMDAEREAYIQERYRDRIVMPLDPRPTLLQKIFKFVFSWIK